MYLLIEHDGTKLNNDIARALKSVAEDNFGATCEYIVGNSSDISVYDDEQRELIKFSGSRSDDELNYILNYIIEEE